MDQDNVDMDTKVIYPVLFIPKTCTTLDTDGEMSDNVYIEVNITTPDTRGNETRIYTGLCNVKLVEADVQNCVESPEQDSSGTSVDNIDVDQMPIIFSDVSQSAFPSYNQSQVWIDPCRSPYVYNRCETPPPSQERCFIRESRGCITVEQHNTYITQNVYNYTEPSNTFTYMGPDNRFDQKKYKKITETAPNQCDSHMTSYEEDEFECGVFLSNLPEEIINEEQNKAREEQRLIGLETENNALKQLMSKDIQSVSKQMKTILFLGNNSQSGQTIQNIAYSDPMVKCSGMEVDHEVIIDNSPSSSTSSKKMYQCDKCKQVYHQISDFHHHIINHTNDSTRSLGRDVPTPSFVCSQCDKNFKSQEKFKMHCLRHGNPDLECPKCRKVYASKFTLRVHLKIHTRRFPCTLCSRSYSMSDQLKTHMSKVHSMITCKYEECLFKTVDPVIMDDHYHSHINMKSSNTDFVDIFYDDISDEDLQGLKEVTSEPDWKCNTRDVANGNDGAMNGGADSVIAKVMSNKIFLLNSKKAKKAERCYKSCEVCYKSFDRISDLKRHLIEHVIRSTLTKLSPASRNGILNIVCEVCKNETFTKIDKYKAHLREHAKLTIYKCTFCDKSFSDSSNFSKHKKIHGMSYYHCDLCHRKFHSKKMLVQHMEYHNQNRPVECHYCNKTFHFKSMLNKHIKCAHNRLALKKYNCRFCDAIFKTLKHKWEHEWMVHNIRKSIIDCLICGSKFRKYAELKRHCLVIHEIDISPRTKLRRNKKRTLYC